MIATCARLVKKVRHSYLVPELLEEDRKLATGCLTRWNSQLAMIRSVLTLKENSLVTLDDDIRPTQYELKVMGEVL